jgi:hypothetical protein
MAAMPSVRGARERSTAGPGTRAGLGPRAGGGRPRGTITRRMGGVDYTLAKRALLMDFQRGILRKPDICDAHPELLRAGRYLGEEATRPCPVCEEGDLRLLAYVFADGLRQNNGRAFQVNEALKLTSKLRSATCYIVEVCLDCSWNHLSEAFLSRPAG